MEAEFEMHYVNTRDERDYHTTFHIKTDANITSDEVRVGIDALCKALGYDLVSLAVREWHLVEVDRVEAVPAGLPKLRLVGEST